MAHYKNMGEGIPQKASFHHLFTANVYDGGCKRLRWRLQTFAGKDANVCGEKRQCTARADAVHCGSGCSALRGRLQCTASETGKTDTEIASPILDKRTGRRDASHGALYPPGNFCRALISDVERTNRKLSFLLAERRVSDISIFGCESVPASLREKKG